jgi:hypothetical protein
MSQLQVSDLDRRITIIEVRNRVIKRKLDSIYTTIKSIFFIASIACLISAGPIPKSQDDKPFRNFSFSDQDGRRRALMTFFNPRRPHDRLRFDGLNRSVLAEIGISHGSAEIGIASDPDKNRLRLIVTSDGRMILFIWDKQGKYTEIDVKQQLKFQNNMWKNK